MSALGGPAIATRVLAALLLVVPAAPGQVAVPIDEDEGDFESMQSRIVGLVRGIIDYTEDVRLTSEGLEAVLEHHGSLAALNARGGMDGLLEKARVDGSYDFDILVRELDYVAWSRERDLDGAWFFGQLLRLQGLRMRDESLGGLDEARQEIPEQRALLERMREEMSEEEYERSLVALETAASMVEETAALMERLPVPTPEEAELLEAHAGRIHAVLEDDEVSP